MARNLLLHPELWEQESQWNSERKQWNLNQEIGEGTYSNDYLYLKSDVPMMPGDYVAGTFYVNETSTPETVEKGRGELRFGASGESIHAYEDAPSKFSILLSGDGEFFISFTGTTYQYSYDGYHTGGGSGWIVPADEEACQPVNFNCQCEDANPSRTLADLRQELLMRLGYAAVASNPPPGMPALLDSFLQGAQRFLYRTYPVLRTERFYTWDMQAGSRFYDLSDSRDECPRKLDARMVSWVGVSECNDQWRSLTCGIPPESYGRHDKQGAPDRYEIRQCIEVWPAPDERLWKLRIKGDFGLEPFVADSDRCTIDDEAVLLHALARAKAHYGHPDAANYERDALTYIKHLTAGAHHTRRYVPGTRVAVPDGWPGFMWEGL